MSLFRTIQWKALVMLTVFAANFMVVCHCSARAAAAASQHSCCRRAEKARSQQPCNDGNGCSGMHAVKFNLLEKQAAHQVTPEPLFPVILALQPPVLEAISIIPGPQRPVYQHPPPDLQSLYQCFLI